MLKLVIPKGSLEEGTFNLFAQANLPIIRKSIRDYNGWINDPRIAEVMVLRPQEIPEYVDDGIFDLGVTGLDWIMERAKNVTIVDDLKFAKKSWNKVKIVLACQSDNPINSAEKVLNKSRVVTEYPQLTKRFFRKLGIQVSIKLSYGATEPKVPKIADYLVDVTETGETLAVHNKKIIAVLLESSTKLIANQESYKDPVKRQAIDEINSLLQGVIYAQSASLIKMNVIQDNLDALLEEVPAMRAPTISQLQIAGGEKWYAVETVIQQKDLNRLIPLFKQLGACDILELRLRKAIP
ncbi:MAG: ATP phosphoribosyltransferase [Patescibacteria group bacterium]|nr:ATP phosphoribosyltransferase [Patescibacteria group bacterium]